MVFPIVGGLGEEIPLLMLRDGGVNYWHRANKLPMQALTAGRERQSYVCDILIDFVDDKQDTIDEFNAGLEAAGLEYAELMKLHAVYSDAENLRTNTSVIEAFEELRGQGKVRCLSLAQHGKMRYEILHAAIDSGWFDVIQLPLNPLATDEDFEVIRHASDSDIGVMAMKTCAWIAKAGTEPPPDGRLDPGVARASLGTAGLKWVLSQPGVTVAAVWVTTESEVEQALAAVDSLPTRAEQVALGRAVAAAGPVWCRLCGEHCEGVGPVAMPISEVALADVHARAHGSPTPDEVQLLRMAQSCTRCGACARHCPYGVDVPRVLAAAARRGA